MAQVRPLKVDATTGMAIEIDTSADDLTMATFTVDGAGIVLNSGGLELNSATISGAGDIAFIDPTTKGLVQTSGGTLAADDIVGKDRDNTMGTAGSILFPTIPDSAATVDAFRLPALAGVPTATPAAGGEGYLIWDSSNENLYAWDGSTWINQNNATVIAPTYTAQTGLGAGVAVCLTSACQLKPANSTTESMARVIGFTQNSAASGVSVGVIGEGKVTMGITGSANIGSRVFLGTASGLLITTPPSVANHQIVQMGYFANSTTLHVQIVPLAIRRT